jgi:hypothetical protein
MPEQSRANARGKSGQMPETRQGRFERLGGKIREASRADPRVKTEHIRGARQGKCATQ